MTREGATPSSSRPVQLHTFSYTPLDPSTHSDLEAGFNKNVQECVTTHEEEEEEEEVEEGGGVEEELIWHEQFELKQRQRRGRYGWIRQVGLFTIGAVVGASFLSVGHWAFSTSNSLSSSSSSSSAAAASTTSPSSPRYPGFDSSFDFASNPPVRIHYREGNKLNSRPALLPPSACPVPVVYTSDQDSADIVVFNSDSQQGLDEDEFKQSREQRPWQKLCIWGVESAPNREGLERHFDKVRRGRRNETYDYDMTYRLNSTVPATYSYSYFNYSNPPAPYALKRHDKIAASFVSNCRPKNARTRILDELTRLLPGQVDNFGRCLNNANADETLREIGHYESVGDHNKWNTKITMINYYLFSIAFENSNDYDYVTEKYFQALERGSVPLVFGAPNYKTRFFPAPNAAIDVAEYLPLNYTLPSRSDSKEPEDLSDEAKAGLERLATRLKFLSSEEGKEEYEAMLSWKLDDRWRRDAENPLAKIVKLATSEWDQDCKLARIFRDGRQGRRKGRPKGNLAVAGILWEDEDKNGNRKNNRFFKQK